MAPDLNEEVNVVVEDADVITVPIDATLKNSGEAADAKAVGDALDLKADKSAVVAIDVNGQGADNQGHILIDGTDIPMSGTDATTLKAKIEAVDGKTGADIMINGEAGAQTVEEVIESIEERGADEIPMSNGSQVTIAAKITAMETVENENSRAIRELDGKTGETILLNTEGDETISQAVKARVRTVNNIAPDETGNVQIEHAITADDLTSSSSQNTSGEWARRTSGGSTPIQNGSAWLSTVRGNRTHVGYVPESLTMTVTPAPREEGQTPITATIDRDVFVGQASSGVYNFVYTTQWNINPETYGITVTGTPVSGDQIVVNYTEEDRGTIIQSFPKTMKATGWNLAKATSEYSGYTHIAIALKYDETAMFKIIGSYTSLKFAATTTGEKTTITPSDGLFTIASNGYLFVAGGSDDTAIYMTWTDWVLDGPTTAQPYVEYTIDMSVLFDGDGEEVDPVFQYGLLRVGDVRDVIDFNTGIATSNVNVMSYSPENLAQAEASGLVYEYDTNYIYIERAVPEINYFDIDGDYTVNDHGLEYFTDTDIAVYAVNVYGNSLKNKLEKDVLTKSQDLVNNLTTNDSTKALSAAQGYALNSNKQDKLSVTITAATGLTWGNHYTTGDNPNFSLVSYGQMRQLRLAFSPKNTSSDWVLVATLDEEHRPRHDMYFYASNDNGSPEMKMMKIFNSTGEIQILAKNIKDYYASVTYIAKVT